MQLLQVLSNGELVFKQMSIDADTGMVGFRGLLVKNTSHLWIL